MSHDRFRVFSLVAAALTMVAGLALRGYGYSIGLTFPVVKYGGSVLWGSMVYFLTLALLPHARRSTTLLAASMFSVAVELFRLVHVDALDAFRLTTAGALLLGRVFSAWNIVAYLVGIALACAVSALFPARSCRKSVSS
ncbi:hypothetical protein ABID16_001249 [Rhizobium aquaticum]|uniref:DUF2809 domain-containing protein n=1 Tax=Rhizobium aquaticum TaxID=1549636 RepID=A0ABV2IWR7_9HYPH